MVATRRATALRGRQRARAGGGGSSSASGPGAAAEMASAEISTPVPVRVTRRRTKSVCKPEVIQESQFEELEHTETKSDVSDSLEVQFTGNESTAVHSPQASGDVSETESSCSAVSGLQTPLFVRVTRRRQIVVPYQSDSSEKKIQDKTTFLSRLSKIMDEDDVSEAESCSSVQMPSVTRTTRRQESKRKLQQDTVHEAQSEDTSDAESCCLSSCMEPSITTKRITRSMQRKLQTANTKQKGNRIVSEHKSLIEDTVGSEPVIISDCRPAAGLLSDTDVSSVTEDNKEPNLPSRSAISSEDVKGQVLNDLTPSSLTKIKQSNVESPGEKTIKNTESVGVDDSEEACGQIQEQPSKILERQGISKCMTLSLTDCMRSKQQLESQGQITLYQSKKIPECKRADAEADVQECFDIAGKLGTGGQSSAASNPQKDIAVAQRNYSFGGPSMLEIGIDGGKDQTAEYAESVSQDSESSSSGNNSVTLFLSKGESNESENSDVMDIDTVEDNLCIEEADEKTPSCNRSLKDSSLHAEGLFVIDTEPGMCSSQKYYLDEVDQDSDSESKHEGSGKDEESSDLEEAEEDLIDEDEKDEDDDLLKTKTDFLSLSSSIDPGLNIEKLGGLYITFDAKKQKPRSNVINQQKEKNKDKLLQNSVITPDFEKKESVPPFRESLHQLKKQRRAEREKTTGDGWFGMKAPEMTSELKNDLKVLKMRASLDPKHFYKKNDRDGLPKYFQVGTVVDSPIDFYHSRIPKKQRKRTIVDELLADSEFRRYNKKKYQEIMSEKAAFAAGKRNRKKKKFHN